LAGLPCKCWNVCGATLSGESIEIALAIGRVAGGTVLMDRNTPQVPIPPRGCHELLAPRRGLTFRASAGSRPNNY